MNATLPGLIQSAKSEFTKYYRVPTALAGAVEECPTPDTPWLLAERVMMSVLDSSENNRTTADDELCARLSNSIEAIRAACTDDLTFAEGLSVMTEVSGLLQTAFAKNGAAPRALLNEYNERSCVVTVFYMTLLLMCCANVDVEYVTRHEDLLVKMANLAGSMLTNVQLFETLQDATTSTFKRCCR